MASGQRLILSLQGNPSGRSSQLDRKEFDARDGRIGRADDCDWVLNTGGVSRLHALVRYLNDIYFIEDRSTNGMLLNGEPMRKGDPAVLKDGDRLQIDCFEVAVNLAQDVPTPAPPEPPALHGILRAEPLPDGLNGLIPGAGHGLVAGAGLDPLELLDAAYAESSAPPSPPMASWNHTPGIADRFQPPRVEAPAPVQPLLPEHWDLTAGQPEPEPASSSSPSSSSSFSPMPVSAPMAPAEAEPDARPDSDSGPAAAPTSDDTAAGGASSTAESLLKLAVGGLIDVLRARAELKNSFRLPVTLVQRSENNPLKFTPDPEEAVRKLLGPPEGAFLDGAAALREAIEDIQRHQLAMLAGMRAAFREMLAQFDPSRYSQADADTRRRMGFGQPRTQAWARYQEAYAALTGQPEESFRRLFGDSFAQAYEEQVAQLKASRPAMGA